MNRSEQALRDQIAFQMGLLCAKIVGNEDFQVSDYIDAIVGVAKKLTPDNTQCPSCGLFTEHAGGCARAPSSAV